MKRSCGFRILFALVIMGLMTGVTAQAVSLSQEVMERLKAEGRLDAFVVQMKVAKAKGVDAPAQVKMKNYAAKPAGAVDTVRVLVLLVEFPDKFHVAADSAPRFDSVLFSQGENLTGSMTEFYMENSYGTFFIKGDVYGWFMMPQNYSYYSPGSSHGLGTYPNNSQGLTVDAVNAADPAIDFSLYDSFGPYGVPDNNVDGLFIVHCGTGYEESGQPSDIHSHKWDLGPAYRQNLDGVYVDDYSIEPEISAKSGKISPIGVFCHEYGHVIGLPDLYDVADTTGRSDGLGDWSLMASGNYNNNSRQPAHLDAWCKIHAGFASSVNVTGNITGVEFPAVEYSPVIYRVWQYGVVSNEYFLVENREQVGSDMALPGPGLLIYHVDDSHGGSNAGIPYHVALEQADGLRQLETAPNNRGDGNDPWPGGTGKRSFDDLSSPDSRDNLGEMTQVSIWNISDPGPVMTANLDVQWSRPYFSLDSVVFADANANHIMEAGENIQFFFYIQNHWLAANDVTVTLSSNDQSIRFTHPSASKTLVLGDGTMANNLSEPIEFRVADTIIPAYDSFFVTITADSGRYSRAFGMERQVGPSQVLIVDASQGKRYDTLYRNDLYKRKVPSDIWSKKTSGTPSGTLMNGYHMVIWSTGDVAADYVVPADIVSMKQYLDNGGNLFLTGQGLASELQSQDSLFLSSYLHASYGGALFGFILKGIGGSPISTDTLFKLRYYSGSNQTVTQFINPINGAIPAFKFSGTASSYNGLSYDGDYKVVFFDWGYEAIQQPPFAGYASRDSLMKDILIFFGAIRTDVNDGHNMAALSKSFELGQNYPNPFNPVTEIKYSLRNINGRPIPNTVLKIYNILGQELKTLVDRKQIPGDYSVQWDGTDESGKHLSSGVYFYKLVRGDDKETRKMVLLK